MTALLAPLNVALNPVDITPLNAPVITAFTSLS